MIKLNLKKLSTVAGQHALAQAIRLDKTMGSKIAFQADPSFKQLFQVDLATLPYSDDLFEILLYQDLAQWETRNSVSEFLRAHVHEIRQTSTVRAIMEHDDRFFRTLVKHAPGNLITAAMIGVNTYRLVSCLQELRGRHYGDEKNKGPVKAPASFVSYVVGRPDHNHGSLRNAMMPGLELCKAFYPDVCKCLIHHMNTQVIKLLRGEVEGHRDKSTPDFSSVLNSLERYMMKPDVGNGSISVSLYDPAEVEIDDLVDKEDA